MTVVSFGAATASQCPTVPALRQKRAGRLGSHSAETKSSRLVVVDVEHLPAESSTGPGRAGDDASKAGVSPTCGEVVEHDRLAVLTLRS